MRGATEVLRDAERSKRISIHAPHAGRDNKYGGRGHHHRYFNPRAPCGARLVVQVFTARFFKFQSTRPMRGATSCHSRKTAAEIFQSTRPMRGATTIWRYVRHDLSDFNPRAPCGARQMSSVNGELRNLFQSTRPMRGATVLAVGLVGSKEISIHAPHAGRDISPMFMPCPPRDFNPRAPCGARLVTIFGPCFLIAISIHAPHAGRDYIGTGQRTEGYAISIHAPHAGRDSNHVAL